MTKMINIILLNLCSCVDEQDDQRQDRGKSDF